MRLIAVEAMAKPHLNFDALSSFPVRCQAGEVRKLTDARGFEMFLISQGGSGLGGQDMEGDDCTSADPI